MTRVIDAHHHLWDPSTADYPWMTVAVAPIARRFAPEDLLPALEAAGVDATMVVQARSSLDETRQLLTTAGRFPWIAGVVGWLDLTATDVAATLANVRAAPGGDRLVGIRHQVDDEPDPDWLLRPDVARGLDIVAHADLVFDLLVRTRELPAAVRTVTDHPGLRFVLDHLAKPPIATGGWQPWADLVSRLADRPNVSVKLSGLVTEARPGRWTVDELRPYAEHVLAAFGPGRVMFGSDWPVCLLEAGYDRVVSIAQDLIGRTDRAGREAIMGGTASRIYGLVEPSTRDAARRRPSPAWRSSTSGSRPRVSSTGPTR